MNFNCSSKGYSVHKCVVLVYFTTLYTTDDAFRLIGQCSLLQFHVINLNSVVLFVFLRHH